MDKLRAFFAHDEAATRVVGTYLYPHRLLGVPDWNDPYSATSVVASVATERGDLLLTRNGGIFMEPPLELSDAMRPGNPADRVADFERKMQFQDELVTTVNKLICEFAVCGVVCEPTSHVHVAVGKLIDGHALITSGAGGREMYTERTMAPSLLLHNGLWRMVQRVEESIVERAARMDVSSRLTDISPSLPTLVAGAYSLVSRQQNGEAVLDAWIVVEQLIDEMWSRHLGEVGDPARRKRLEDTRTYSAAVRIEALQRAGLVPEHLAAAMHVARTHRNALAHRATTDARAVSETSDCMKRTIEFVTGASVEPPLTSRHLTW